MRETDSGTIVGALRDRWWAGAAMAISTAIIGLGLRAAAGGGVGSGFPYLTFFPLVIATTLIAGRGAGIAAALLSLAAAWAFIIPPGRFGFARDGSTTLALAAFVVLFSLTIATLDWLARLLERLRRERDRSRDLAAARDAAAAAATAGREALAAIVDHAAVGIAREDMDGRITLINDGFCLILGRDRDALLGTRIVELTHPDDLAASHAATADLIATGQPYMLEKRYRRPDGSFVWTRLRVSLTRDAAGAPWSLIAVAVDIDEAVRARGLEAKLAATLQTQVADAVRAERAAAGKLAAAEGALRQAQKMEAVGQLTGGIAHDFNNLLTVIAGNLDLARRALDHPGPEARWRAQRLLDNAAKGSERAAAMTRRLLSFARQQPLDAQPADPAILIADVAELLARAGGDSIVLDIVARPGGWPVSVDRNQFESALLNLVVNARDAMPGGGTVTITVTDVTLTADDAAGDAGPGDYVAVSVADTGEGLDAAAAARVFEPFFTTKPAGKGTGLGLSMVYGFARQSRGVARFDSEVGRGTTVTLLLPRFHGALPDAASAASGAATPGGGETILLVEDDADVRAYAAEQLRTLGYTVVEAESGEAALAGIAALPPGSLLLTDVVMPGLGGLALASAALTRNPELRILFTTGYAEGIGLGDAVLPKPFDGRALAAKVRSVLDG